MAVTELSFGHVTTKTWTYSGVFGFFSKTFRQKKMSNPTQITFSKPENTEMCKYPYFRVFWFGHFPRSGVESESSFLIKYYIITVLNFFLERFGQY